VKSSLWPLLLAACLVMSAPPARAAAALSDSPSLRRYLSLRSQALLSGDYYASDRAWLDVKDNLIDAVVGLIETYEDATRSLLGRTEAVPVDVTFTYPL